MAATPEEFLGQGAFLAVPEPFSPSVFLDLPPTPRPDGGSDGEDPSLSDDLVLPFISRMLMEEDIDDKFFYQYPDHSALLAAQEPFAQILSTAATAAAFSSDATTTISSDSATTNTDASGSSTLSPSLAEATWPYDQIELSQLLRSPPYSDMGLGLDDFTAGDVTAFVQEGTSAGFQQSPALFKGAGADQATAFLNGGGGGGRGPFDGQTGGVAAIQSSGFLVGAEEEDTKPKITTLPPGDGDLGALVAAFFSGQNNGNMDMLNMAFLKGMEEAKKFLPANSSLFIDLEATPGKSLPGDRMLPSSSTADQVKEEDVAQMVMFRGSSNGRGRKNRQHEEDLEAETGRNSKLMMPEQEETGASQLFDEIMSCNFEEFMKRMQDLRIAKDRESEKSTRRGSGKGARGRQCTNEVVDLCTMLIHCVQAVVTGDSRSANEILKQIKQHSSPRGDATQRLAHCFAEGLEARLGGTGSQVYQSLMAQRTSVVDFLKAYKLLMAASSMKRVNIIFSNKTIYDAMAGRSKLHIVDYGVQHGFQWPGLLYFLAKREGGPPEVRFTGIDVPQPGFRPAYQIEKTGDRLSSCARQFGIPFKFHGIAAKWETVSAKEIDIHPDEMLVVNCNCHLSNLVDDSVDVDSPSPRDMVLNNIRKMRPDVFIHCVVNGTYGAPFFLTRFRETLLFYSAHFDMLDATIPRDSDERMLIERDIFGRAALNVIACEGADRVDRPETYKQWQLRNQRAGLRQLPLNPEVVKLVNDRVKNYYHKDFLVDVDHRWLLQGWKGRVLYAMSTWVAEDNKPIF